MPAGPARAPVPAAVQALPVVRRRRQQRRVLRPGPAGPRRDVQG